jgi:predicted nucleotidyltransferase component of viral defense system
VDTLVTRPILSVPRGFDPPVVEKVERLLEMLDAIANNPYLKSRLILHGGTALNVFHADMPRLSVDIDLAYVGSQAVEGMRQERPRVDGEVRALAARLGYAARSLHNEHSGQSYRLRYDADSIKVDVSYLARVPLLEPVMLTCSRCRPTVAFATLQLPELIAGKVSALVDRTAPRDQIPLPLSAETVSGRFLLRMPRDLHARAAREAARQGASLNTWIVAALAERLGAGTGSEVQPGPRDRAAG